MKKYKYEHSFWVDGKRYTVRADTKKDLIAREVIKRQQIEAGTLSTGRDITVDEWIGHCFETYKPRASEETVSNELYRVKKHISPAIGHLPMRRVTNSKLQQILNDQAGMSYSHVRSLRQEIEFIFSTALRDNKITKNPAEGLIMPNFVKGQRRAITAVEREHLLKVCNKDEHFVLFLLMLYTGCRPGEAVECMRSDIVDVDGVHRLHIRGTKTENADRVVPMPDHLFAHFEDLPADAPLCVNAAGRKHSESSYKRLTDRLRRELNISMGVKTYRNKLVPPLLLADDFVPYLLRHTYCTDLAHARVDIRIAQRLMGHSDIMITANIYTHAGDDLEELSETAALLDAYYKKTGEKEGKN